MRKFLSFATALSLMGGMIFSATGEDWDAKWKELCTYDAKFCGHLKNGDGTWKKPKLPVVEALKILAPNVQEAGALYDVDPRAIAGAILAENSLNVTTTDDLEDWIVKHKIWGGGSHGSFLGRKFSFGWGQLYLDAAKDAEPLAAQLEKRPVRTDEEIAQELLKPESAIKYVAAVLRRVQDVYLKHGFDIKDKPEILDTVYNLGRSEERATAAESEKRQPRMNYFGFFVSHYLGDIEGAVGKKKQAVAVNPPAPPPPPPATAASAAPAPTPVEPKIKQTVTTGYLTLYVSPPSCSTDGSGQEGEYKAVDTQVGYGTTGKIKPNTAYKVVMPGMLCNLEPWSLIRGQDGSFGWTRDEFLKKYSATKLLPAPKCAPVANQECADKLKAKTKNEFIAADADGSLILRLIGTKKKMSWKKINGGWCGTNYSAGGGPPPGPSGTPIKYDIKKLKPEEAAELTKLIEATKTNILGILAKDAKEKGVYFNESWDDYGNPYKVVFDSTNNNDRLHALVDCIPGKDGSKPGFECSTDPTAVKAVLSREFKAAPSYREIKELVAAFAIPVKHEEVKTEKPGAPSPELEKARAELKASVKPCVEAAKNLPQASAYLRRLNEAIDTQPLTGPVHSYKNNITNLKSECETLGQIFAEPVGENKTSNSGGYCSLNIPMGNNNTVWGNTNPAGLKSMLQTNADRDEYLVDKLKASIYEYILNPQGSNYSGSKNDDDGSCSYLPFKTAEYIERLLKEKCVKTVFVPDPWLLKRLKAQGARVMYRPFLEEDRFAVDMSEFKCEGGAK